MRKFVRQFQDIVQKPQKREKRFSKVQGGQAKPLRQIVQQLQTGNTFGIVQLQTDYDDDLDGDVIVRPPVDPLTDISAIRQNVENLQRKIDAENRRQKQIKDEKDKIFVPE